MLSIHVQGKILPHYKELILMEISICWKAYSKPCLDYTVCFAYNRTNCFSRSVIFIKVPLKRHEVFSFRWHWFKDRCLNQSYLFTETPCTIIWNSPTGRCHWKETVELQLWSLHCTQMPFLAHCFPTTVLVLYMYMYVTGFNVCHIQGQSLNLGPSDFEYPLIFNWATYFILLNISSFYPVLK